MAIGDVTPKEWLQKALDMTPANSTIAGAVNVRRYITGISVSLQTGSTTKRTVSVYKNGTAAANEVLRIPLDPTGVFAQVVTELPFFLVSGQTAYFKQDAGADVTIAVYGVEEALT